MSTWVQTGEPVDRGSASAYERLAPWQARIDALKQSADAAHAAWSAENGQLDRLAGKLRAARAELEDAKRLSISRKHLAARWSSFDDDSSPQQAKVDRSAADAAADALKIAESELGRLEGQKAATYARQRPHEERFQACLALAGSCKAWLETHMDAILDGKEPVPAKASKQPATPKLIDQIRGEITDARSELESLESAYSTDAERAEAIDLAIDGLARDFLARGSDTPMSGEDLARARPGAVIFSGTGILSHGGDAMTALCWLVPQLVKERLLAMASEATPSAAERLSAEALAARRASIEARLYETERREELAIRTLEAEGQSILRRADADPCAVTAP